MQEEDFFGGNLCPSGKEVVVSASLLSDVSQLMGDLSQLASTDNVDVASGTVTCPKGGILDCWMWVESGVHFVPFIILCVSFIHLEVLKSLKCLLHVLDTQTTCVSPVLDCFSADLLFKH